MSWSQNAKAGLWALYNSLIDALSANQVPELNNIALPTWNAQATTEIEAFQYLTLLAAYQWYGKIWSPTAHQMMIEVLYYYRHFIYNWYADANWPIAQQLETLSNFVYMLEQASAYQLTSSSTNCQTNLQAVLEKLRLDLNQWVNGAISTEEINSQIARSTEFISRICA